MRMIMKRWLLAVTLAAGMVPAWGATRAVVLSVPGMTCSACPITVRKALERVAGVRAIRIDTDARTVEVSFDDARTRVEDLTRATAEAGYASSVRSASP